MKAALERSLLQHVVAFAALVPIGAGALGAIAGPRFYGLTGDQTAVSHGRYLSGLLLGIGLAFWTTIPKIETQGERFSLLTGIVFFDGCARLAGVIAAGRIPSAEIVFALSMELLVTPGIWLWRCHLQNL